MKENNAVCPVQTTNNNGIHLDQVHHWNKKPELLIPASNLEVLKTAVIYGADAVYIGGEMYGLRAKAKNFSLEDMEKGIQFAYSHGKKVYVTANITAHNEDLSGVTRYFKELKEIKPDAIIISDPGVFEIAQEILPEIDIHISTQANNVNYGTYRFWHRMGAKRVVSARELSLEEIKGIRENIPEDLEIETFVHGAMCIAYSGRCLLSNYFTGRDANRGACTHPCRWKYYLTEETRPGEYLPIEENERGTFIFNSKDLCMIEYIPELIHSGINSFKVEGRMKTALYVASVARTYRKAIDDYFESPDHYQENISYYKEEISKCTYRQFTTGFFFGKPNDEAQIYDNNTYIKEYTYLGIINGKNEAGLYELEQRNKFSVGEEIEIMKPDGRNLKVTVKKITDEEGTEMESCPHPKQKIYADFGTDLDLNDILRRKED
jgi:putative protease